MTQVPIASSGEVNQTDLQTDIKKFAERLPYWGQMLASKILSGNTVGDSDLEASYNVLLEDLDLLPKTIERTNLNFSIGNSSDNIYLNDLKFEELKELEGVNALAEKQSLKLHPNLTIVYGANGSGKSGYARLMKRVFYSKSKEDILPNVHLSQNLKKPAAVFCFSNGAENLELKFPDDVGHSAFTQFSVFDGKAVISHIDQRNQLSFRPAGLSFFSEYTEAVKKMEARIQGALATRQSDNYFSDLFEGDSPIKEMVSGLSANTKIAELNKYLPFNEEDQVEKSKNEIEYDKILIASKSKDQQIKQLENMKQLISQAKTSIEKLNSFFSENALEKISNQISDCVSKEIIAKQQGSENFKTDYIQEIGGDEWKSFITAANTFAQKQKAGINYPSKGEYCILCHQPLSEESVELISKYWKFLKSEAEKMATVAQTQLQQTQSIFEKLEFNVFPDENILTEWMKVEKASDLAILKSQLLTLRELAGSLINDMKNRYQIKREVLVVEVKVLDDISEKISEKINGFTDQEQLVELRDLLKKRTLFSHREKLQQQIKSIEKFIENQIWIKKASKANSVWGKRGITDTEKELSGKYFNQKYIDTFNEECQILDGQFDIQVTNTGAAGVSYRQLTLKGKSPSVVLSEGEQKVIALADFIAEMRMSSINRGMVYDDPVTSLDEYRKKRIAEHLVELSKNVQIIVFSHDLVFVSALITSCQDNKINFDSHWIEKRDEQPGMIFLNNSPSYEKEYRNNTIPIRYYSEAKKDDCQPSKRESLISEGFTALRTCYEVLVINDLFKNVVQRFNERVSIDSLKEVSLSHELIDEIGVNFGLCCRYMKGHTHSDAFAYQKPELSNLKEEIDRYDDIKKKIKEGRKQK
jgi:energy-coupling factor transporter ATP-binding protein EcfA2